jgi:hypothetical protein
MSLADWDMNRHVPDDFYATVDVLWCLIDGKVEKVRKCTYDMKYQGTAPEGSVCEHHEHWGGKAWDIAERGYYHAGLGLVTCHGPIDASLRKKLARAFRDAVYVKGR